MFILLAVTAYGAIGLAVRDRLFPREPVYMAAAWPVAAILTVKK